MLNIILFLFPSFIAVLVKERFFKEKLNNKDYIFLYTKYNLLINIFAFGILSLYSFGNVVNISYSVDTISFVFKFLVMSTTLAVIVPVLDEYFKKNVDIKLEIGKFLEKNEKRKTSKKKKNNK